MSASANKDRFYTSIGKSRRSSPGDSQGNPFFQTGQGGRTVLPSFSTAFPNLPFPGPYSNAYTAPRSSPGRYDLNPQAFYQPQWPTGNSPPLAPAFPNYDTTPHERHSPQPAAYGTYSARGSPPLMSGPTDPRRLPPLSTSPGGDRWQQSANYGVPAVHGYSSSNSIRSPAASYPSAYVAYPSTTQASAYTYHMPTYDHLPSMNPQGHGPMFDSLEPVRLEPRSTSPYNRGSGSQVSGPNYTPPPVSPTSPEEPTIKKKRKRADAAQLKVLNETYARTAFPSTEERHSLAKALDMSARSVQIWFQNKRQSMRQTNRQSSTVGSSAHQQFGLSQSERLIDEMSHAQSSYTTGPMPVAEPSYMTGGSSQDVRSHTSHSSSSHRRLRSPEEVEQAHKWPRGGY